MAIITPLSGIYNFFENGDAPTGSDFRNLIDTCVGTNSAQNLSTYTTVNQNSATWNVGGGGNTGNITFEGSTLLGPAGSVDSYKVRIKPSDNFDNTIAFYPTADNDVHVFEDSALGGAVTLGNYGKTQLTVQGNGGTSTSVDNIVASTVNDGYIQLNTSTSSWTFSGNKLKFPDGTEQTTAAVAPSLLKSVITRTTGGVPNLYIPTSTDEIILCDPNAAGDNIYISLPDNPQVGKVYTIKNVNPGSYAAYVDVVNTAIAIETEYGMVGTGIYITLANKGSVVSVVYGYNAYRIISYFAGTP